MTADHTCCAFQGVFDGPYQSGSYGNINNIFFGFHCVAIFTKLLEIKHSIVFNV